MTPQQWGWPGGQGFSLKHRLSDSLANERFREEAGRSVPDSRGPLVKAAGGPGPRLRVPCLRDHTSSSLLLPAAGPPGERPGPTGLRQLEAGGQPDARGFHTHTGQPASSAPWDPAQNGPARPRSDCPLPGGQGPGSGARREPSGPERVYHFTGGMDLLSSEPSRMKPDTRFHHLSSIKIPPLPGRLGSATRVPGTLALDPRAVHAAKRRALAAPTALGGGGVYLRGIVWVR